MKTAQSISWQERGAGKNGRRRAAATILLLIPAARGTGITDIAAGGAHSLALRNGGVVHWGHAAGTPPDGLSSGVTAITAGNNSNLALKNGGVVAWRASNRSGQKNVPASATNGITAIAAGQDYTIALKNGGVIGWGIYQAFISGSFAFLPATAVPLAARSGVVAIAADNAHSLALKWDGTVVAWGINVNGETDVQAAFRAADGASLSIARAGIGQMAISWPTKMGRTNQLQTATDLVAGVWSDLGPARAGDGSFHTVTVSAGSAPAFYRLLQ